MSTSLQNLMLVFENAALVVSKYLEASFERVVKALVLPMVVNYKCCRIMGLIYYLPLSQKQTPLYFHT